MQRITPFDNEACVMLESLTEREVVATEMDDNFTIHAFYNKHNNPDYISAIIDAARGRFGKRFIGVSDEPEREMLKFTIAYDKHELPMLAGDLQTGIPHADFGTIYCHQLEEIRAVQVTRLNVDRLQIFVGGGQMSIEKKPDGKAWFSFLNNGTFVDVPEYSYIVKRENGNHFEIWPADKFKKEWEPKN